MVAMAGKESVSENMDDARVKAAARRLAAVTLPSRHLSTFEAAASIRGKSPR